jgi:hypothetical protein
MEVSDQFHTQTAFPSPQKEPPVFTAKEVGWIPEPAWILWKTETFFTPARNRTPDVQPIVFTIPTELSQLP